MSVNDANLLYSSDWDIDQLVSSATVPVGAGDTNIFPITGDTPIPTFEIYLQPTGSTFWYQAGFNCSSNTFASAFALYGYISGNAIFVHSGFGGIVRYFVWEDKVNY